MNKHVDDNITIAMIRVQIQNLRSIWENIITESLNMSEDHPIHEKLSSLFEEINKIERTIE